MSVVSYADWIDQHRGELHDVRARRTTVMATMFAPGSGAMPAPSLVSAIADLTRREKRLQSFLHDRGVRP